MRHEAHLCSRRPFELDFNVLTGTFEDFDWSNPLICHGKGSGGGTNTVTQSSQPPAQVLAAYQTALNSAQSAASAPLQQYQGATVAGFTPDQTSAFGTIDNAQGIQNPYLSSASSALQSSQTPLWGSVAPVNASTINQYESPYTQQVLQGQEAVEQNQDAQQQTALQGNAISSGAWGGDRAGVASGVLSGQQDIANNATNANILNQGYNTALSEANTQQQAQLGANEANSYLNAQAGSLYGALGTEAQNTALQGASAQLQSGALQQQLGQEALNVPYENFLQAQAYPFQTSSFFTNAAEGTGALEGGTGTTTSPAASSTSQLAGLGLGGLGLLGGATSGSSSSGSSGKSKNRGGRIPYRGGGRVPRGYDSGGPIDPLDIVIVPSSGSSGARGEGPPKPPPAYKAPAGAGGLGGTGLSLSGFTSAGQGLGSLFGGSSGSSGDALGAAGSMLGSDAGDEASSGAAADMLGDLMRRGGVARGHRYAIGGEVLPDVVSGIGDIVGAFFGDPAAGDQGTQMLSMIDGGRTEGEGIEGRAFGSIMGDSNEQGGFRRGGRARFDAGGNVGGQTATSAALASQQQPTIGGAVNSMTPQQLQNYLLRLPPGSQQAQQLQQIINQKEMTPNVGQPAQGGFSSQPQQSGNMSMGQGMTPQGGFKRGGFADGGDPDYSNGIPLDGPPPDDMSGATAQRVADLGDLPTQIPPVPDAALAPPSGAMGTQRSAGMGAAPPPSPPPADTNTSSAPPSDRATYDDKLIEKLQGRQAASANPWMALANAGFAMAAGNSPQAMQNIGAGALAGIRNYQDQTKQATDVNDAADKLLDEAQTHKAQIANEAQNSDINRQKMLNEATYQQGTLKQKQIMKDNFGNIIGTYDPVTNSILPIKGMPGIGGPQTSTFNVNGSMSGSPMGAPAQVGGQNAAAAPAASALPEDMQQRLQQVASNPKDQAIITGLIQGRIPPNRQALGSNPQAYLAAAAYVDSTFDTANPTARIKTATAYAAGGPQGNMITSLNTASRHAAATALAAIDLGNSSLTPWNAITNSAETATGDPRVTNYNSYLGNYGHEAIKVISGKTNPGEAETEEFMKPLSPNGSTEQLLGALSAKNGMMLSRAEEMQNSYNQIMGPAGRQQSVISPAAQQAFQDMDTLTAAAHNGALNSPDAQAARARLEAYAKPGKNGANTTQPAQTAHPLEGRTATGPNGAKMIMQGGQWVPYGQ